MKGRTMTWLLAFALGAVLATWFVHHRVRSLAAIDFRVTYPPVPVSVTSAVRAAEARFYSGQGMLRGLVEEAQDIAALVWPPLVARMDSSVGPYRIKASTIAELMPWAQAQGYLTVIEADPHQALAAIAYFSEQPALADWGATLVLEHLRQRHPELREMDWETIAAEPRHVAKLYSGYMGAGGDWAAWEATLEPGPEALRRLDMTGSDR